MDEIESASPSPNPKKRQAPLDTSDEKPLNLTGGQFMLQTPPDTSGSSNAGGPETIGKDGAERGASPAPSSSALSSIETTYNELLDGAGEPTNTTTQTQNASGPPAKKRKLTASEKEAKEKLKAQQKAEKESDKAKREEEKRVKDLEKQRKAEEKEAKKREKALEEERKEQEKAKKERQQMRLGAFFQKPSTPLKSSCDNFQSPSKSLIGNSSISIISPTKTNEITNISQLSGEDTYVSEYHKTFLPFQLPSHSTMAPRPSRDPSELASAILAFDRVITSEDRSTREGTRAWCEEYFGKQCMLRRGVEVESVRKLTEMIDGTSQRPVDLTESEGSDVLLHKMRKAVVRHLHFHEDVRPAYFGTYTKIRSLDTMHRAATHPFDRVRPDTDYELDSEAEWEEPDEGDEDCLSEEDDEVDSQGDADEIEAFLDDEEDAMKHKAKAVVSDLAPESTGLCWEGMSDINCFEGMKDMGIEFIVPGFTGQTIDPFSTDYWTAAAVAGSQVNLNAGSQGVMAPPRRPLQPRLNSSGSLQQDLVGAAEGQKGPITSSAAAQRAKRAPKPPPKTLSKEDLEEFKEAVVGSPLGKIDLLKGLKSRFPKITQDTIKETLGSHFAQIGNNRAEKKWVFVSNV